MSAPEIRVWWIPQVPMTEFVYDVPTIDAGIMLCDVLAKYDLFQYENKVKPDYCNTGGVMWRHPTAATVDIVERGIAAVIDNALAGLVLPSSAYVASRIHDAQVELRTKSERDRAALFVAGEGEC